MTIQLPGRTVMLFADIDATIVAFFMITILFIGIVFAVVSRYGGIWFQAYMSGVPISVLDIIGMKFRRTNVKAVVRAVIAAKQGGAAVSFTDMEKAYLQGANLEKLNSCMSPGSW